MPRVVSHARNFKIAPGIRRASNMDINGSVAALRFFFTVTLVYAASRSRPRSYVLIGRSWVSTTLALPILRCSNSPGPPEEMATGGAPTVLRRPAVLGMPGDAIGLGGRAIQPVEVRPK